MMAPHLLNSSLSWTSYWQWTGRRWSGRRQPGETLKRMSFKSVIQSVKKGCVVKNFLLHTPGAVSGTQSPMNDCEFYA